jgi:hypothetical protein
MTARRRPCSVTLAGSAIDPVGRDRSMAALFHPYRNIRGPRRLTMKDRSPIRRFLDECDEVAGYHPNASHKIVVSRDILHEWRDLDASAWRAEGWEDVAAVTAPGQDDEGFRQVLESALSVAAIQIVEAPPDYLEVTPI